MIRAGHGAGRRTVANDERVVGVDEHGPDPVLLQPGDGNVRHRRNVEVRLQHLAMLARVREGAREGLHARWG